MFQFQQLLIDQPTRITKDLSNIIDLFLTNDASNFTHYGVSEIGISDHNLIGYFRVALNLIMKARLSA